MQTAIAPTLLPHTSVGTCPQHGHPNTKYPSSLTSSICINWNVLPCLLTHFPKGGNLMSMFILLGQAPEVLCFWSVSGRSLLGPVSKAWLDVVGQTTKVTCPPTSVETGCLGRGHGPVSHPNTFPEKGKLSPWVSRDPAIPPWPGDYPKSPSLFLMSNLTKILCLVLVKSFFASLLPECFWFIQEEKYRLWFRKWF